LGEAAPLAASVLASATTIGSGTFSCAHTTFVSLDQWRHTATGSGAELADAVAASINARATRHTRSKHSQSSNANCVYRRIEHGLQQELENVHVAREFVIHVLRNQ
jgi:hypothetical protein